MTQEFLLSELERHLGRKIENGVVNGYADMTCWPHSAIPTGITFNDAAGFGDCKSLTTLATCTFNFWASFYGCTSLTTLHADITFNGVAIFDGCTHPEFLSKYAVTDCGNSNRTLVAVRCVDGKYRVRIGCFWGTESEAISAVIGEYGDTEAGRQYIFKIRLAFEKARVNFPNQ